MSFRDHIDITGELLRDAWKDYASNFWRIAVLSFIAAFPKMLILAIIAVNEYASSANSVISIGSCITIPLMLLFGLSNFLLRIMTYAAAYRLFELGRIKDPEAGMLKAIRMGWGSYWKFLLTTLASSIPIALPLVTVYYLESCGFITYVVLLTILPFAICGACWILIRLCLSPAACLFEGWGVVRSMVRSFVMTAGSFWILFMAFALVCILCVPFRYLADMIGSPVVTLVNCFASEWISCAISCFMIAVSYRAYLRLSGEG